MRTNVVRILGQMKIRHNEYEYGRHEAVSAVEVADIIGKPAEMVFKTLVTVGHSGRNYVFMIPAAKEMNLKKAAVSVGEKSIEMVKSKDLLALTGYVHGGCSPVGMKKTFTTVIDKSAGKQESIIFSAGRIGCQVELSLEALSKVIAFDLADICD